MRSNKLLNRAIALALTTMSTLACAVSLGDLTVQSRPGEPMQATLQIEDLDLTISPLLVRVAPPSTYLRVGVPWAQPVQDLQLVRDGSQSTIQIKVVGTNPLSVQSFPLLIELNAGGKVSVRNYQIVARDGHFEVLEGAVAPAVGTSHPMLSGAPEVQGAKSAPAEAQKPAVQPLSAPAEKATAKPAAKHRAPEIVREYVALNGFDATQPFNVQRSMTLWSVAKLYWPSYRGATLEQLLIAFRNHNPEAFVKGNPDELLSGSKLVPPSEKDVFAIDALEAFKEIHGANTAVPPPTQNLIDAQKLSNTLAGKVADAQDRERTEGKTLEDIERAGRAALESGKEVLNGKDSAVEASGLQAAADANAAQGEGTPSAEAASDKNEEPSRAHNDDAADAAATGLSPEEPKAEEAKPEEGEKAQDSAQSEGVSATETKSEEAAKVSEEAPKAEEATPAASDSAPSSEAASNATEEQKAESAPGDASAEKQDAQESSSYWWAGLGGLILLLLIWFIKTRRRDEEEEEETKPKGVILQSEIKPATAAALSAVEKTVDEAVKNGTTAGAMGVGSMAYSEALQKELKEAKADQPWLDPNDEELPPIDEELSSAATAEQSEKAGQVIKSVSLDLDEGEEEEEAGAKDEKGAKENAPVSNKELALQAALEAKYNLAKSFVGIGALNEALELLDEVRRRGTPEQRERAAELAATIPIASSKDKA
ncbi:MAG: hypothetical protein ACLTVB_02570 [Sutterella sp.]